MLTGGDFNLNSVQRYTDSLKEVVKQTMLHHETIFRNQVYELHRLYRIQKALMRDLSWNEFDRYTSWTEITQSTSLPFQDLQKHKLLAEEKTFLAPPMVGSTSITDWNLLEECQGTYSKLQQTPLNLQLPADEYISNVGTEFRKKGNLWPPVKESIKTKDFLCGNHVPDPEEVKPSLNSGEVRSKKGDSSRSWYDKKSCLSTPDGIDSEESIKRALDEDVKPVSSLTYEAPAIYVGDKHGVQVPCQSDPSSSARMRKDISHRIFMKNSLTDQSESSPECKSNSVDTGLNECHAGSPFISLSSGKQPLSPYDTTHLDLNVVQHDESSCLSNDPLLTFPSLTENSPGVVQGFGTFYKGTQSVATNGRKPHNSCSDETSDIRQQHNSVFSALTDFRGKHCNIQQTCNVSTKSENNSGIEVRVIDLESMPEDSEDLFKDFGNHGIKPSNEIVDLSLELPNGVLHEDIPMGTSNVTPISKVESNELRASSGCTVLPRTAGDAEVGHVESEKSEEDSVSSGPYRSHVVVQDGHHKASNATSKINCGIIKDLQSGTEDVQELEISNHSAFEESGATRLGSQIEDTQSYEQDPFVETGVYAFTEERSSDGSKSEHQYHNQKPTEVTDLDILVRTAAESLIQFSLENSLCSQDWFAKAGSNELENKESNEQPQYSSDSFESITLRLKESSVDDYCVSSTLVEVNETEKNGCRWNLKRGRRMKDFQKDILPGLVSLSRHEICEDINIIGTALRSKEFRKNNRSRNLVEEDWCLPVRSRRSKVNYFGRRNYS